MRQRVAFLRTLVAGKPVLALDEPFASLDAITRAEMQEWLAGALAADPRTVVLVTHDVEEALYLSDRVAVLSARPARIVAELERPDAAGRRPRRRRHRPELRRRPRAGDGAPCTRARDEALAPARPAARGADRRLADRRRAPARSPTLLNLEDFLVPSPAEIAASLWENRSLLAENAWVTLREIAARLRLRARRRARASRSPCTSRETLRRASYPLVVASQTIPIVVIAPILVVWFGFGIGPKLAIVALICFFPITVNTLDGLRSVDPEAIEDDAHPRRLALADPPAGRGADRPALRLQRRQDRRRRRRRSAPSSASGPAPNSGLGHLILQDNAQLETARLFAAVAVLSAIALAPLRPARARGAPHRHLAIESRG